MLCRIWEKSECVHNECELLQHRCGETLRFWHVFVFGSYREVEDYRFKILFEVLEGFDKNRMKLFTSLVSH